MTYPEIKQKLDLARNLIFEVEKSLELDSLPRLAGYQARIKLGQMEDLIKEQNQGEQPLRQIFIKINRQ